MFKKMIFVCALLMAASFLFAAEKNVMYVGQKNAVLKNKDSVFGKTIRNLEAGQEVVVVSEKGSWMKVTVDLGEKNYTGWLKKSLLTKKKPGFTKITVDSETISLAGKGSENTVEAPVIQDDDTDEENLISDYVDEK